MNRNAVKSHSNQHCDLLWYLTMLRTCSTHLFGKVYLFFRNIRLFRDHSLIKCINFSAEPPNTFAMPVMFATEAAAGNIKEFVRLFESPGIVQLQQKKMNNMVPHILGVLWPTLLLLLVSAGYAAVFIWLLVC